MEVVHFLKGAAIGFSLAAPVGPVGILCIRRTLENGGRFGLVIGVSAAVCDMVYGIVAAFGVTLVSHFIVDHEFWIRLVGGIILLAIGQHVFRRRSVAERDMGGHVRAFFSTALLVFSNPLTLFGFAAAMAIVGTRGIVGDPVAGTMLVGGVFVGSLVWFVLLTGLARIFKDRIMRVGIVVVN